MPSLPYTDKAIFLALIVLLLLLQAGESPLEMGPIQEEIYAPQNPIKVFLRFFLGFAAASYYFFIPVYMYLKHLVWPRSLPGF